jgi:predicted nucleic acid-binding protein
MAKLAREHRALITTDWVLTEFLNTASRQPVRDAAVRSVRAILASSSVEVAEATRGDWQRAINLYEERSDKQWSLVDCTSILLCGARGVGQVFTADRHFQQAGFEILLA